MMPPAYVNPYARRQKNDAADAAAICEAVTRPSMRFVGVRSLENQAALMRHKTREMLVSCDETIPFEVCEALAPLAWCNCGTSTKRLLGLSATSPGLDQFSQFTGVSGPLRRDDADFVQVATQAVQQLRSLKLAQKDETTRRLMGIPGFGPITASAMAATVQDTSSFAGPREFAAFLGLTPKQNSSGGKPKLGRISKMGNRNLRKLLVVGVPAIAFMMQCLPRRRRSMATAC